MPVKFRKQLIATERYESAGVFDVNGNGMLDIVCGDYWYEGPSFRLRHVIGEVKAIDEHFDDFATIPLDVNGNGRLDYVTGGWWGDTIRWRENPGEPDATWPEHVIAHCGNVETIRAWDVDGDGQLEIVPSTPNGPLVIYKLVTDKQDRGTSRFVAHTIYQEGQGHGLGFGDISGSERGDFVLANGWLEAPDDPYTGEWVFHPDFSLGSGSVPILVVDVNGNGLSDLVVGQGHAYGLDWWEQRVSGAGARTWCKHPIDPFNSQYHDVQWVDIDGDGECEIVTGKRYRAHSGRDPGAYDDIGMCYFKWNDESFTKQMISYGPLGVGAGCGLSFAIVDLYGNGRLDIVAPGKDGLQVFKNMGL